ncbi:YjjG family noncanonical pyrimidine nucleotidase [Salinimicrobium catena]|uniref:YjjG family noncanonical pyrimidine nucleotidase n=1 Tax=Salinimicrobium catena TaxID=390640 RepID=UPI002FE4693B
MTFHNLQHIFFDLDHTLWDFDRNSGLAFNSIFKKNRIAVELDEFLEAYSPINMDYWKKYRENRVSKEDLRYGRLKDTFDVLKINVTDEEIDQLSVDYIDHLPNHNHLLEGTVEMLEYLHPKYKLHIITNGFKEVQHKKMESSGILKYFNTVTTSEDVGVKKPDRLIFEAALKNASAKIEESIMIGDNFEADILGAHSFGMPAILYNYYKQEFSPEYHQVLEMKELAKFF